MKTYTEEFKKTIVELYENGNKNKSELAREYGTSEANVRAWIKQYGKIKTSTGQIHTYETFKEARIAIFEFIESWYNNTRIHSSNGYITPNQKYAEY